MLRLAKGLVFENGAGYESIGQECRYCMACVTSTRQGKVQDSHLPRPLFPGVRIPTTHR